MALQGLNALLCSLRNWGPERENSWYPQCTQLWHLLKIPGLFVSLRCPYSLDFFTTRTKDMSIET